MKQMKNYDDHKPRVIKSGLLKLLELLKLQKNKICASQTAEENIYIALHSIYQQQSISSGQKNFFFPCVLIPIHKQSQQFCKEKPHSGPHSFILELNTLRMKCFVFSLATLLSPPPSGRGHKDKRAAALFV